MKTKKIICYILIGIAVLTLTYILITSLMKKDEKKEPKVDAKPVVGEKDDIKVIDLNSKSRPYAVMINNISDARPYQSGLQDAYIVYEIIVEGGITRMMALFKDQNTARIGSVRSSRHYYLDYALENDAIYVHYGWSPQAQSDITTLKINNINGLYDSAFWRDTTLNIAYEHTAFTSIEKIESVVDSKGYRKETNQELLLNYVSDEIDLSKSDDVIKAEDVRIQYSNSNLVSYKYDVASKVYYRSVNGIANNDYVTKKQYFTKNIIVTYISNDDMNGNKGRQNLNNIGSGEGYYITNGYAIPITWDKSTRKAQTVYKSKDGKEINVNDGNTFIQIAPPNSTTIS